MIVKIPLVLAIFVFNAKDASSASFSKVFVQSGADYPPEYVQYGAPTVTLANQQLAQLNAPVAAVVPYSPNYVPCGTPCVYPGQAAIAPSANIVQYQPQGLPVVVARNEPAAAYEYSYVVYDEQTGDQKLQRESSDGSVVRGGYSFLQPDGFVRDVQYVADDTKGFNAVVKHFVPVTVEGSKKHEQTEKPAPDPCNEVKNEQLKAHKGQQDQSLELQDHNTDPTHENMVESHAEKHEDIKHEPEKHEPAPSKNPPHEEHHAAPEEHKGHVEEIHKELPVLNKETKKEPKPLVEETKAQKSNPKPQETHIEEIHKESAPHDIVKVPESQKEPKTAVAENTIENTNILVPYNDIIRCVQSAIKGANTASSQKLDSPLTYIVLNKPC